MTPSLFRIGLLLTFQCNAECKHCLFECSPEKTEKMPRDIALKAIHEAKILGAEWVSFSGGEPFLEQSLLTELVEAAHELGIKTEAVTNGFWGESGDYVKKVLTPLVDSGLDVLNLSIDDFHNEFISVEQVRNAYWGAIELGLKMVLMVSKGRKPQIITETVPELLGDTQIQVLGKARLNNPNAVVFETQFTPVGRGVELEYEPVLITSLQCHEVLRDIGVKPNGDVLPCCGPLGSLETIGNLNEESLESMLNRANKNPRLVKIRAGFDLHGCYSSKCHACVEN